MTAPGVKSIHDMPIRSHCIVLSFTTGSPMSSNNAAAAARRIIMDSDLGVYYCMAGPAGGQKNGEHIAFRIAANVANMPDDQLPEQMRLMKAQFIQETGHGQET